MRTRPALRAITLKPFELLCLVCSAGEETAGGQPSGRVGKALAAIAESPDRPLTLRCDAGGVYAYQDVGPDEDSPGGHEFNRKRDLDILQRLDLAPGSTLPSRTLLMRVFEAIPTVAGICGYETTTAEAWQGCPDWNAGRYERGHARGIGAIIAPRSEKEMTAEKEASMAALRSAAQVTIRPHILMCSVCQYGGGLRPPYAADNLPELLELVLGERPGLPITMARGADWMMCAPCPARAPDLNACVNVAGSGGLSNEKRDLDLLQRLGLTYGSTMAARDLYLLLLERVPTTREVCRRDNPRRSVWWDACGERNDAGGNEDYLKGRGMLLELLKGHGG
jgi:hypothetical protein